MVRYAVAAASAAVGTTAPGAGSTNGNAATSKSGAFSGNSSDDPCCLVGAEGRTKSNSSDAYFSGHDFKTK